jgi:hypothetical protein
VKLGAKRQIVLAHFGRLQGFAREASRNAPAARTPFRTEEFIVQISSPQPGRRAVLRAGSASLAAFAAALCLAGNAAADAVPADIPQEQQGNPSGHRHIIGLL